MAVLIGIVGYCAFVRGYPLGPLLMERLCASTWPVEVEVRDLNWGPVAIVQEFQAMAQRPSRVVLVGPVDRGLATGAVRCCRWAGGELDLEAVQRRMFEAVTGIVSLDNLLVIGAHFGIWPEATWTVELQWPPSGLGDLVLEEAVATRGAAIVGEQPPSAANARIVELLAASARALALDAPLAGVHTRTAAQLSPVAAVAHHRFVDEPGPPP